VSFADCAAVFEYRGAADFTQHKEARPWRIAKKIYG
jgi:hypothetical protein